MDVVKGKLLFPHLITPDTRFDADGVYKTSLICDPEEVEGIVSELEAARDELYEKTVKGTKSAAAKKQIIKADVTRPALDRDGEETGEVEFRFKSKYPPKLWDAKKNQIQEELEIGNGTVAKIMFQPNAYYVPSSKTVGVTLYVNHVQILDLSSYGSPDGFEEEDGYVVETMPEENAVPVEVVDDDDDPLADL